MKALRDYIILEIQTRLPQFKTVRIFNNQFERSNNDNFEDNIEAAFGYPACFIEFEEVNVRNVALGVKYVDLIVRLHLGLENYTKKRPTDYITVDDVSDAMQGMRGDATDTVQFSSMREENVIIDSDFNNINLPVLEFSTTYTKLSNYDRKNFITKSAPTSLQTDVTVTVEEEGTPISPADYGFNYPQPTGQTIIYRTNDDAWVEQNIFAAARLENLLKPKNTLKDFFTLNDINIFGNTNRFTDIDGLQIYGDGYIIDNYTGLGWSRNYESTDLDWNGAIDAGSSFAENGFFDWFLSNDNQMDSIKNMGQSASYNYAPFNYSVARDIWTSTTYPTNTTNAMTAFRTGGIVSITQKISATPRRFFCRKHF